MQYKWGAVRVIYLFLLLLAVGLTFSSKWIGYEYQMFISGDIDQVLPVRYGSGQPQDDYFYYSRIRDMIDGNFMSFDPISLENRYVPNPHSNYQLSYILGSVGGWIDGQTKTAFYFNKFFFPILGAYLAFLIIYRFTQAFFLSSFFAAAAIIFNFFYTPEQFLQIVNYYLTNPLDGPRVLQFTQVPRMPNTLITNVHLSALLLAIMALLRHSRPVTTIAVIALLGLSAYISVHNFLLSYALAGCVFLLCVRGAEMRLRLLGVGLAALVISLPGILVLFKGAELTEEMVQYSLLSDYIQANPFDADTFWRWIQILTLSTGVVLLGGGAHRKLLLSVTLSAVLVFVFMSVFWGTFFGELAMIRGVAVLLAVAVSVGLIGILRWMSSVMPEFLRGGGERMARSTGGIVVACFFSLVFFGLNITNDYSSDRDEYTLDDYRGGKFARLADWSVSGTGSDKVAITLDFDLLVNLPVYSPLNLYVPQALLSSARADERLQRFFEAARFYGMTADDMDRMLSEMTSHYNLPYKTDSERQNALMQLVLFYGRHVSVPMPTDERASLVVQYDTLHASADKLSWQGDYLIVSTADRAWVRPGSHAAHVMAEHPIYDNGRYAVYALKGSSVP